MSDREKLIELLDETFDKQYDRNLVITARNTADHLISNGVTLQKWSGCKYCNGLTMSQMESFTMPNASKKDYDIVTIRYCPMCGRKLSEPPKECE